MVGSNSEHQLNLTPVEDLRKSPKSQVGFEIFHFSGPVLEKANVKFATVYGM